MGHIKKSLPGIEHYGNAIAWGGHKLTDQIAIEPLEPGQFVSLPQRQPVAREGAVRSAQIRLLKSDFRRGFCNPLHARYPKGDRPKYDNRRDGDNSHCSR